MNQIEKNIHYLFSIYLILNKFLAKKTCKHISNVDENITPIILGCEEYEKEKTYWVALRTYLIFGVM